MQAQTLRALKAQNALPITPASLDAALRLLDAVVEEVAADYRETLAPAIERVWREEIGAIARDLRGWLRRVGEDGGPWIPTHFELAFGLTVDADHDPASTPDPVRIDGRFLLRGSVDLVEAHASDPTLRVTDHKTGKDRTKESLVIGGGAVLQPVLYSLAVEAVTRRPVAEARLFFCTTAGGYNVRPVALTAQARRAGIEALEIIDRAIEEGSLAAAPAPDACTRCDFRPVCGPVEEPRVARKPVDRVRDLIELRSRP
jgi:CRISPR/Cas system-associated exonuclease Cas4 (RecB family)